MQRTEIAEIYEGQAVTHRRQIFASDGTTLLIRDDVLYMVARVYDLDSGTPDVPTFTESLVIDEVVFDTPQSWRKDSTGFNFEWTAAGQYFPDGGNRYLVEIDVVIESDSPVEFSTTIPGEFFVNTKTRRGV